MNDDPLKTLIGALPEPAPGPEIERVVMARIARLAAAEQRLVRPVPDRAHRWLDLSAWVMSVSGLLLFFAAWIGGLVASGALSRALSSPFSAASALAKMPMDFGAILGLTIGAAMYVAGIFARSRPSSHIARRRT